MNTRFSEERKNLCCRLRLSLGQAALPTSFVCHPLLTKFRQGIPLSEERIKFNRNVLCYWPGFMTHPTQKESSIKHKKKEKRERKTIC